ncbi:helix-hairpin-helix domain-containing protein [Salicibibacter cibarius]|uniref:Helix-hairpin-helix domain-containing protein n=1 Tax=Salicibibacter cibarius TaxID=2743000 RepID=A0A7T7CBE4_9BACI|nr:helix-hairpin-helix domain-containing protein [Salicibibacter cibarius]QQK75800.1 helix-hairpin-helix domain-containing protein [Salicibibacter cibarius]
MDQRYLLYGGAILVVIITIAGGVWLFSSEADTDEDAVPEDAFLFEEDTVDLEEEPDETEQIEEETTEVFIDVKGEVARPGIYEMELARRVDDAIREAGGVTEEANENAINFAQKLEDEMVVYVPHEDEEDYVGWEETASETSNEGEGEGEKININAADETTLQQLSGVGPVTAEAIAQYREENGDFEEKSDIQNVSGIGEKTYQQLEDHIDVN